LLFASLHFVCQNTFLGLVFPALLCDFFSRFSSLAAKIRFVRANHSFFFSQLKNHCGSTFLLRSMFGGSNDS
jgi:hypothetical protein